MPNIICVNKTSYDPKNCITEKIHGVNKPPIIFTPYYSTLMPLRYLQIFPSSSAQACISFHISNQTILRYALYVPHLIYQENNGPKLEASHC